MDARPLATLAFAVWLSLSLPLLGQTSDAKPPPLKCDRGPIEKSYGKTPWLVYSCEDGRSLVLVTAPGSPAMPFYFMLYARDEAYRLYGEGTGSKAFTDAAYRELSVLSAAEIKALIEQTKSHKK